MPTPHPSLLRSPHVRASRRRGRDAGGTAPPVMETLESRVLLAVDAVCIPWGLASLDMPHEIYNGKAAILKATVTGGTLPVQCTWDFGDGTPTVVQNLTTEASRLTVEVSHTYANSGDGTPFNATLTVRDAGGATDSDQYKIVVRDPTVFPQVKADVAIDTSLWWFHKNMARTTSGGVPVGYWSEAGYSGALTALTVLAFENQSHLPSGDSTQDPYVLDAQRGLNYLFTQMSSQSISGPNSSCPYGNPDSNSNGIGINMSAGQGRYTYEIGPTMMALAATGTPNALSLTGPANVYNRAYKDILQDMVDLCAWGQDESGNGRGGWRYGWNYGDSDNSITQWPVLGMQAAEGAGMAWGIVVPSFVKRELEIWLNHSQYANGGWMYTDSYPNSDDHAHAGAGIFALAYLGYDPATDTRIQKGLSWLNTYWNANVWTSMPAGTIWNNKYGMYAVMKGLREAGVTAVGTHDWYAEFCNSLVSGQSTAGTWSATSTWSSGYILDSVLSLLTLEPTIAKVPPVAMLNVSPLQGPAGQVFTFDGSASYQPDPARHIIRYTFDFGDGTTYTETASSAPDGLFDGKTTHAYPDTVADLLSLPGFKHDYTATLTVYDDDPVGSRSASVKPVVTVSYENHPPVSDPGGPYIAYVGVPLTLNGAGSYDPDAGYPWYNHIASYGWELDGIAPYDYDDATTVATNYTWTTTGIKNVALKVTDAYTAPHTTITWTTVDVREGIPTVTFVRPDLEGEYSDTFDLMAQLTTTTGAAVAGKTLEFYVDADHDGSFDPTTEALGLAVTDGLGWARLPYTAMIKPDFYVLQAVFQGDGPYFTSQDTDYLEVEKEEVALTYTGDMTGQSGRTSTLSAVLVENDGPAVVGRTLGFTLGSQSATATTGATGAGTAAMVLTQPAGPYSVATDFAGDDYYEAATLSTPFSIVQTLATGLIVNDGEAQRSMIKSLKVTFDHPIASFVAGAFVVTRQGGGTVPVAGVIAVDGMSVRLTFPGGLNVDGRYTLAVHSALITDSGGMHLAADATFGFYRLLGDFDGAIGADGKASVTLADQALFSSHYRSVRGDSRYDVAFDLNGDGKIDAFDMALWRNYYGHKI